MRLYPRHDWSVPPRDAVALQTFLAREVIDHTPVHVEALRTVAGVDASYKDGIARAAVVVMTFPGMEVVETAVAERDEDFPYVTGLLSFREGPVLEDAFRKLTRTPDAFLFDGMGIAHPRRIGIASHMGLWLERPTVGVGKTRLIGRHGPVGERRGEQALLEHRGEVIGAVLRTRDRVAPVYVSPGHRADIGSAVALVLACGGKYRLPEPIRAAHGLAGRPLSPR